MHKTLTGWKATRSSFGISVKGVDPETGGELRLSNLESIEVTESGIVATDQSGQRHRLSV